MPRTFILATAIAVGLGAAGVTWAQTSPAPSAATAQPTRRPHNAATETGRNAAQQKRIEQGLKSGQLTSGEARRLEAGQARIDKSEQRALRNGKLSASERARIQHQQNRESKAIHRQKHDAQTGNPNSLKSNLEQANVARNLHQQQRLHQGVTHGSLTNRELGHLESREAHSDRIESRRDTPRNAAKVQRADHRTSRRIFRQKHDRQGRH